MFNSRWAPILMVIAVAALLGLGVTARSQMQWQQPSGQTPGAQTPGAQFPGAQTPGAQFPGQLPSLDGGRDSDQETAIERQQQVKQAEKRNEQRQAQLVQDTARLFDLAKELKDQVGKTNKDILSVDVVKKADEIEKLAKSVRDKMKAE